MGPFALLLLASGLLASFTVGSDDDEDENTPASPEPEPQMDPLPVADALDEDDAPEQAEQADTDPVSM